MRHKTKQRKAFTTNLLSAWPITHHSESIWGEIDLATAGRIFSFMAGLTVTCALWTLLRKTKPA